MRRSFLKLHLAAGPQARLLIWSGLFWTVPLALGEPWRMLHLKNLGLGVTQIGWLLAVDGVLRVAGFAVSPWVMRRLGARRLLTLADLLSWTVAWACLALATGPVLAAASVLLASTNALANTAYQSLLADGMKQRRRAGGYALMHLSNLLPGALLSSLAGSLVEATPDGTFLRAVFAIQALSTAAGIYMRWKHLPPDPPLSTSSGVSGAHEFHSPSPVATVWPPPFLRVPAFLVAAAQLALLQVAMVIWNGFAAIHMTRTLGLPDGVPGLAAQLSAAAMLVGLLLIAPRIQPGRGLVLASRAFAAMSVCTLLLVVPSTAAVGLYAMLTGVLGAVAIPVVWARLPDALPIHERARGFAWGWGIAFLAQGVASPMAARLVDDPKSWMFPAMLAVLFGLQSLLSRRADVSRRG